MDNTTDNIPIDNIPVDNIPIDNNPVDNISSIDEFMDVETALEMIKILEEETAPLVLEARIITGSDSDSYEESEPDIDEFGDTLYEDNLALAERLGEVVKRNLTIDEIEEIPCCKLSDMKKSSDDSSDDSSFSGLQVCGVCQDDYHEKSIIKILNCKHSFHRLCIDMWLYKKNSCPLCRKSARIEKPNDKEEDNLSSDHEQVPDNSAM